LEKQLRLASEIDDALNSATQTSRQISSLRAQLAALQARIAGDPAKKDIAASLQQIDQRAAELDGPEEAVWPAKKSGLRGIDEALAELAISLGRADTAPTLQASEEFATLKKQLSSFASQWEAFKQKDLSAFNQQIREAGIPAVGIEALRSR
jgi:hypothetical protein